VSASGVYLNVIRTLENRVPVRSRRERTVKEYHPYRDGKSSERVIEALDGYIKDNGVPEERKLPFFKKMALPREHSKNIRYNT